MSGHDPLDSYGPGFVAALRIFAGKAVTAGDLGVATRALVAAGSIDGSAGVPPTETSPDKPTPVVAEREAYAAYRTRREAELLGATDPASGIPSLLTPPSPEAERLRGLAGGENGVVRRVDR